MLISLDAYRVFYYAAQYRSFTKAAEALYSNQPNVTRAVRNLEQALGCSLFVRSRKGVRLTPEGEALYAHVAPAMEQLRAGEEAVLRHASLQGGTIRVAASEIALDHTLLPVMKEFRRQYPQVHLRIYNATTPQALASLRERTADLALVTTPLESCQELKTQELVRFRDLPVCGPAYRALAERSLPLAELAAYPLVCLHKGTATYELYQRFFQQHGLALSPDIEAAASNQVLPMVRADLGIAFVPEDTAREAAAAGDVYCLTLEEELPRRAICLLKRRDLPLSAAARELERMLLAHTAPAQGAVLAAE